MKLIKHDKSEMIRGGASLPRELCMGGGATLFAGGIALGIGIATGGLGFVVAGGLGLYFGTTVGLACAM